MNQRNQISDLTDFAQKAIKLGKYNSNTGGGILNAVRAAERGLSSDEPNNIDYLVNHLEELFFRQKDLNLSPQSLAVYFARIRKVVDDYKKYGLDAKAIYSWSPKIRKPVVKTKANGKKGAAQADQEEEEEDTLSPPQPNSKPEEIIKEMNGVKLNVLTWRLRPGVLVKIELPENLTRADVEKLKRLLDLELEVFE